jgi:hypothetical protein
MQDLHVKLYLAKVRLIYYISNIEWFNRQPLFDRGWYQARCLLVLLLPSNLHVIPPLDDRIDPCSKATTLHGQLNALYHRSANENSNACDSFFRIRYPLELELMR